jgi:hypothetical protein
MTATGSVTINGRVAEGVSVVFHKVGKGSGESGHAQTSVDGAFTVKVSDGPGAYSVRFYKQGFLLVGHDAIADIGPDGGPLRFDLSGPSLMVEVDGWTGTTPLDIVLTYLPVSATSLVRYRHQLRSRQELPVRLDAVAAGTYGISASQEVDGENATLVSEVVDFVAESGQQAPVHIVLGLAHRSGRVAIVTQSGQPVDRASVRSRTTVLADLGSSVFDSSPVPPGERLHVVAPGLVRSVFIRPLPASLTSHSRRVSRCGWFSVTCQVWIDHPAISPGAESIAPSP